MWLQYIEIERLDLKLFLDRKHFSGRIVTRVVDIDNFTVCVEKACVVLL